jgi:hypothetical protein
MLKYFLLWFPMLLIAIGNGLLREGLFRRYMHEFSAHRLSTVTLIVFFAIYIGLVIYNFPPTRNEALLTGLVWLVMTLVFEFGFGRWRGTSWSVLLEDYNIIKGRLWILVPLWVAFAPYIFYRVWR